MIEKLTPTQEKLLTEFRAEWFKIGVSTDPADKPKAEAAVIAMLQIAKKFNNQEIIWMPSWRTAEVYINKQNGVVPPQKLIYYGSWFDGQIDAYWISFYLFCRDILGVEYKEQDNILLDWHAQLCKSASRVYFFEKIILICDRPEKISMKNERLHCDNGPSVRFRDGWEIYNLNGVRVPKWLVMTSSEKIDPKLALEEKNVDIQREIIRKIGAERLLTHCNANTLDNWDDPKTGYNYKLMDMTIGDNIRRKYLYFEHASMKGVFYAKPVPPECTTALAARAWILSMVEQGDLKNINESEIIANLPQYVS